MLVLVELKLGGNPSFPRFSMKPGGIIMGNPSFPRFSMKPGGIII